MKDHFSLIVLHCLVALVVISTIFISIRYFFFYIKSKSRLAKKANPELKLVDRDENGNFTLLVDGKPHPRRVLAFTEKEIEHLFDFQKLGTKEGKLELLDNLFDENSSSPLFMKGIIVKIIEKYYEKEYEEEYNNGTLVIEIFSEDVSFFRKNDAFKNKEMSKSFINLMEEIFPDYTFWIYFDSWNNPKYNFGCIFFKRHNFFNF